MLAKRIIPCLDVTGGRVVKGVNFVELRDAGDPVEIAARYNEQGADELTFLDITATSDGRDLILHDHRGGRRRRSSSRSPSAAACARVGDVRRLLNAGADKVSFNSAAVAEPAGDPRRVGASTARSASSSPSTPSAPARDGAAGWDVYTHGGRQNTGLDAVDVGAPHGRARRRRDPADQHGPRRHQERLRPRADARGQRRGRRAGDRLGRRRHARAPGRRHPHRRRRRGAGGEHLPLRRVHGRARPRRCWRATASRCGSEAAAGAAAGAPAATAARGAHHRRRSGSAASCRWPTGRACGRRRTACARRCSTGSART